MYFQKQLDRVSRNISLSGCCSCKSIHNKLLILKKVEIVTKYTLHNKLLIWKRQGGSVDSDALKYVLDGNIIRPRLYEKKVDPFALGSISAAFSSLVYVPPPRSEFGGGAQAAIPNSGW